MSFCNSYPEAFKIEAVKRYLNGETRARLCHELGLSKSTMWGWVCKYKGLVEKEWSFERKPDASSDGAFVEIRHQCQKAIQASIVEETANTVRIFANGYAIICHISKLDQVWRAINND